MLMAKATNKKLAVISTYGAGIRSWIKAGYFNRTKKFYNRYVSRFSQVFFVTYDRRRERTIGKRVKVLINSKKHSNFLYSLSLPIIHRRYLSKADIVMTTQMMGAWSGVIAKLLFRRPLVIHCGYEWSEFEKRAGSRAKYFLAKIFEIFAYNFADKIIVTSPRHKENASKWVKRDKIVVIPNGVETSNFKPIKVGKEPRSLIFVGRLSREKNLASLIKAISGMNVKLFLAGAGELKGELRELAKKCDSNVNFLGAIPNTELPKVLNKYEIFILPSLYEGHPKALLEAMACQLPVIGSKVEGIKEVIEHGKDGLLCEPSPNGIKRAIIQLMKNKHLREKLGRNAKRKILDKFTVEKQIDAQIDLLVSMVE